MPLRGAGCVPDSANVKFCGLMMLALEIRRNGDLLATVSTENATSVGLSLLAFGQELQRLKPGHGPVTLSVGGLAESSNGNARGHLEWINNQMCAVGDAICIRVIELGPGEGDSPKIEGIPANIVKRIFPRPSLLARLIDWVSRRREAK